MPGQCAKLWGIKNFEAIVNGEKRKKMKEKKKKKKREEKRETRNQLVGSMLVAVDRTIINNVYNTTIPGVNVDDTLLE